jgi:hypothetical protein
VSWLIIHEENRASAQTHWRALDSGVNSRSAAVDRLFAEIGDLLESLLPKRLAVWNRWTELDGESWSR